MMPHVIRTLVTIEPSTLGVYDDFGVVHSRRKLMYIHVSKADVPCVVYVMLKINTSPQSPPSFLLSDNLHYVILDLIK